MDKTLDAIRIPLAGLEEESIVDGPGLRFVLFTQGCKHNCKGCQNPKTHPLTGGTPYSLAHLLSLYDENPLLDGMTFSGGEPFLHARALSLLAKEIHDRHGTIVTYTGYTYERLQEIIHSEKNKEWAALLELTDLLIDGPYIETERDLDLLFRGSTNQRLLDREQRKALDQ
ncbi:MAG: 4Fe-4S cluster-binding domain-containing protein [Desulfovibrio sp.]|nr:4Fe-4S cluster-binding domain-containing protein [Desulfovibrio sp.]